jgi:hypothetical protein
MAMFSGRMRARFFFHPQLRVSTLAQTTGTAMANLDTE